MRCASLPTMVEATHAALARVRKLAQERARAETAYRRAVAAEREEIARLMTQREAGTVAIATAIGRTREAVRQSYRQWRKERGEP